MKTKDKIPFSEFLEIEKKLDIRIGKIIHAERVPKSSKLLKLTVIFGVNEEDQKTVVTNIGSTHEPEFLFDLTMPFIVNLEPVTMMGIVSEAMIVVGTNDDAEKPRVGLDYFSVGSKLI